MNLLLRQGEELTDGFKIEDLRKLIVLSETNEQAFTVLG